MRKITGKEDAGFFERLLNRFSGISETGSAKVRIGKKFLRKKKYEKAIEAFYEAIAYNDNDKDAYMGIGETLLAKGDHHMQEAIGCFQKAVNIDPIYIHGHERIIETYLKFDLKKKALEVRRKLSVIKMLKEDPENPTMNNNLGIFLLKQGRFKQALNYFQKSILYDTSFKTGYVNYAIAMYKYASSFEEQRRADNLFQKSIESANMALKFGDDLNAVLIKIRCLIRLKKYADALETCKDAKEIDPGCKEIYTLEKNILKNRAYDEEDMSSYRKFRQNTGEAKKSEESSNKEGSIIQDESDRI